MKKKRNGKTKEFIAAYITLTITYKKKFLDKKYTKNKQTEKEREIMRQ